MTATLQEKILAWLGHQFGDDPNPWPANAMINSLEGMAYVRTTPAWGGNPPMITLARINYEEDLRGQGRFTRLLEALFGLGDAVICVESVMNRRLNTHLNSLTPPGRRRVVAGWLPDCPTFYWSPE